METNIKDTPEFWRPDQVFQRAKKQSGIPRVHTLITRLAESGKAPDAVRYWARHCVEMKL